MDNKFFDSQADQIIKQLNDRTILDMTTLRFTKGALLRFIERHDEGLREGVTESKIEEFITIVPDEPKMKVDVVDAKGTGKEDVVVEPHEWSSIPVYILVGSATRECLDKNINQLRSFGIRNVILTQVEKNRDVYNYDLAYLQSIEKAIISGFKECFIFIDTCIFNKSFVKELNLQFDTIMEKGSSVLLGYEDASTIIPKSEYNPVVYKELYSDIAVMSNDKATMHYSQYGINEHRVCSRCIKKPKMKPKNICGVFINLKTFKQSGQKISLFGNTEILCPLLCISPLTPPKKAGCLIPWEYFI